MKINLTEEWCLRMADLEGDSEVGAGALARDPVQIGVRPRTLEEIRNTPVLLLTAEEIDQLSPDEQDYARLCQANRAREMACKAHEPEGTSTRNGWHSLKCKHCGKNMSYDSGD